MATPQHKRPQTLKPGFWVALTLRPGAAPLRVYVGQLQDVDAYGVRITLIDWLIGSASGFDFYAPWTEITSALVATTDQDTTSFGDTAADWQKHMSADGQEPPHP